MKKIVLRNLPPEIQLAIKRKALIDDISREEAVVELIRETEIERMACHEVAIMESLEMEEGEPF